MIKVVVADDEEKVALLICNLVDWKAFDMEIVGVAHNGIEALSLVRRTSPDLLVTDIRMPGCDGLELIRRAREIVPTMEYIIISGYRYFEYAQSAIKYGVSDYLLKPIKKEELTATLEKMRWNYLRRTQQLSLQEQMQLRLQSDSERMRAGLFAALVDAKPEALSLEQINAEYRYDMKPGCFQAVLLKIDGHYETVQSEGLAVLKKKVETTINEQLAPACFDMQVLFVQTTAQLILNYPVGEKGAMREVLRGVLDDLRVQSSAFPGTILTAALGCVGEEPKDLWESMRLANLALANRLLKGTGTLLDYVESAPHGVESAVLLAPASRALEAALEIKDVAGVKEAVKRFADNVLTMKELGGQDILYLADGFYDVYILLCRKLGFQLKTEGATHEEFRDRLDVCGSAAEVMDCLMQTISSTFTTAMQAQGEEDAKPIRNAKRYIAENFSESISLEQVASEIGFNPSYFSTLFKKEVGQTFSEYMQEMRINKAKELLRETNYSVADICQEVGYTDIKHFSSIFKKVAGIKPGEFRKLYS